MTTARGPVGDIRSALAECKYDAEDGWSPSESDLECVVDKLGYKPPPEAWEAVGLFWATETRYSS